MVSYLPVGSEQATKWYAEQALRAGVGFVNAIPVFIGREPYWQRRFAEAGLPVIGDDIKSQVGATISHRVLTRLFMDRGVRLDRTYQLNFGGNTDFLNMLERERLESKKISQDERGHLDARLRDGRRTTSTSARPTTCRGCEDRKWCYIRMEGTTFGDVPLNAELKLEVWDSPNSAGVITDAIRCLKLGLDRGLKGTLVAPSAYFMKSPPSRSTTTSRSTGSRRSSAARTTRRSSAPRSRPTRKLRKLAGAPAKVATAAARDRRTAAPRTGREQAGETDRRSRHPIDAGGASPRVVERLAVLGLPGDGLAAAARCRRARRRGHRARLSQLSYLAWPTKRRWSNRNFGHVLGLPPDHPRVRADGPARLPRLWPLSRRADAPAVACRPRRSPGWPRASMPTRSERLWRGARRRRADLRGRPRRQQRRGGRGDRPPRACRSASSPTTRPSRSSSRSCAASASAGACASSRWRNLREIFGVLRRREMLAPARRLGLPLRRDPGAAVRRSGRRCPRARRRSPRKTGSRILPITIRRQADDTFLVTLARPDRRRVVAIRPSSSARPRRSPTPSPRRSPPPPSSGTASSRSGRRRRPRRPTSSDARC